jgi:hypothetical protein
MTVGFIGRHPRRASGSTAPLPLAELRLISNKTPNPLQCSGLQFERHENILRHVILAVEPVSAGWKKTKLWIVFRVSYHNNRIVAHLAAAFQAAVHQCGSYAFPLELTQYRQRSQAQGSGAWVGILDGDYCK